jgi:RecA-family ATPase
MSEKRTSAKDSQPVSIGKFLDYEFPEGPPVIGGGILPAGGGLILAGESGIGKSLMRQEIAILLSIGNSVYGLRTPASQRIIIFQMENTPKMEQSRTKRLMAGLGIESLPDHIFYAQPHKERSLKNEKFLKHALEQIKQVQATVFILDPLISFHNENENDNVKMRSVLDRVTYLSRQTASASLLVHHFGKPNRDAPTELAYRMRGAQAIKDWSDSVITVTRVQDNTGHEKRTLRQVDFIKIRNGPPRSPITLERNGNFVHSLTAPPGKATPQLVYELVKQYGHDIGSQNDLCKLIQGRVKCAKRTAQRAIEVATQEGYIIHEKVDGVCKYTPSY